MKGTYKVGDVAKKTRLTVRTLHHYEEIGLLVPSGRTESGHRVYTENDVTALLKIVALKQLGFPLAEIKTCLEKGEPSAPEILARRMAKLQNQIELEKNLYRRLDGVRAALLTAGRVSMDEFFKSIEEMNMIEKYYTEEVLNEIEARRQKLGDEGMKKAQESWPHLIAEVKAEIAKGTDPKSPTGRALADRWSALVGAFTGGNPQIAKSLTKMWQNEKQVAGFDTGEMRGLMEFIQKAKGN